MRITLISAAMTNARVSRFDYIKVACFPETAPYCRDTSSRLLILVAGDVQIA